jgi:hypothetical protein
LAELDADPPTSSDDDYTIIKRLANHWIHQWEQEEGTLWNELWAQASFNNTGATSYSLTSSVSNMMFPGGYVLFTSSTSSNTYFNVVKPERVTDLKDNTQAFCYFTGNPQSGFTLYFNPNYYPTGSTGTINFPYYKKATELSTGGSLLEMSDPEFVIHGCVSDWIVKKDPAESDRHFQIAQGKLRGMKTRNLMDIWSQENKIPQRSYGFGV